MFKSQRVEILRKWQRVKALPWYYWVIGGLILGALIVLISGLSYWRLWVFHDWSELQQDPTADTKKKFDASLEIAKSIVSIAGTVTTFGGGIVLYLNFTVANKNVKVANENVVIANKNYELAESRLVAERFSKAVEQLGSDKIEVRLGGIYALERIAYDSDRDHWTIMEVLTSFIQEKSSVKQLTQEKISAKAYEMWEQGKVNGDTTATDEQNWESAIRELAYELTTKEIHAAFTVICRRQEKDPPGRSLVISGAILSDVNMHAGQLSGLRCIDLRGADLSDSCLIGTNLSLVDLSGAILRGTNLSSAILIAANLNKANLIDTNLNKASLSGSDLSRAILWNANLSHSGLCSTNLSHAQLDGADLSYAELRDANLTSATLINAKFIGANLFEANLIDANHLTVEQLATANLCKTTLSDNIDPNLKNRDCKKIEIPGN
jgi:uncharacterized protein YjbI with pentapeptide repeats